MRYWAQRPLTIQEQDQFGDKNNKYFQLLAAIKNEKYHLKNKGRL